MRHAAHLVALALAAAGCGGLETPDLATGSVAGRLSTASAGAYAYVLGHAEIFTSVAADGTFRLDEVPAGSQDLVLFDGATGALLEPVQVRSADVVDVAVDVPLPPAGAVVAGPNPLTGQLPTGLTFGVDGTVIQDRPASPSASLFPLPAGTYVLRARQPGFRDTTALVQVVAGQSVPESIALEVDPESASPGCVSAGCDSGLYCDPASGNCYLCVQDSDCGAGICTADHLCQSSTGTGTACQACNPAKNGSDCTSPVPPAAPACATTNEHGTSVPSYCTNTCTSDTGCLAGYKCQGGACLVGLSCTAYAATFGATCLSDDVCGGALDGASCQRPAGASGDAPGYCTATCQAGCPTAGFGCPAPSGSCLMQCGPTSPCPSGFTCGATTAGYCG